MSRIGRIETYYGYFEIRTECGEVTIISLKTKYEEAINYMLEVLGKMNGKFKPYIDNPLKKYYDLVLFLRLNRGDEEDNLNYLFQKYPIKLVGVCAEFKMLHEYLKELVNQFRDCRIKKITIEDVV